MVLIVWLSLAAAWVLFLVPVLVVRRRVDRYAWPAWQMVLVDDVADHYAYLRELLEGNQALLRELFTVAERHRERGRLPQARERLGSLFEIVAGFVGRARERLDEWLVICRAALALYPLDPPEVGRFRLRALRGVARVHHALHRLAVTSGERFRLRLRTLDQSFRLLARISDRTGKRFGGRRVNDPLRADWDRASAIVHDFDVLSEETLRSARALLAVEGSLRGRRKK